MEKTYINGVQDQRLEKIETRLTALEKQISNELTHMKLDIQKIKDRVGWQMWLISGACAIIGFLISQLF